MKMYHGTTRQNAERIRRNGFMQSSSGMLGTGVYLSRDKDKARAYPKERGLHPADQVVIQVDVRIGRQIKITYQGHPKQKTWHDYGYDSAWVPPDCGMVPSGMEETCVWDPDRVEFIKIIETRAQRNIHEAFSILNGMFS